MRSRGGTQRAQRNAEKRQRCRDSSDDSSEEGTEESECEDARNLESSSEDSDTQETEMVYHIVQNHNLDHQYELGSTVEVKDESVNEQVTGGIVEPIEESQIGEQVIVPLITQQYLKSEDAPSLLNIQLSEDQAPDAISEVVVQTGPVLDWCPEIGLQLSL